MIRELRHSKGDDFFFSTFSSFGDFFSTSSFVMKDSTLYKGLLICGT